MSTSASYLAKYSSRFSRVFLLLAMVTALLAVSMANIATAGDPSESDLRLLRVTPVGTDVPIPEQVVFTFDRDMVPIGRMDREASEVQVEITPPLDCQWRWLNTTSLSCQLRSDAPASPATRYVVRVSASISALDGTKLGRPHESVFLTQRPAIDRAYVSQWLAPGMPEVEIRAKRSITRESLMSHVYFRIGGRRIPATTAGPPASAQFLLRPGEMLPPDSDVALVVEPGLRDVVGGQPGVEERELLAMHSFPEFELLGLRCSVEGESESRFFPLASGATDLGETRCDPLGGVSLVFSSPVIKEELAPNLVATPDFAGGRSDYDPWEAVRSYSSLRRSRRKGQQYGVGLPSPLRANQRYVLSADRAAIRDEFGRPLESGIDLRFDTAHRKPRAYLRHPISVLERDAESQLPITVTNKQQIRFSGTRISVDRIEPFDWTVPVPAAEDVAFDLPLPLRDQFSERSGVLVGEMTSSPGSAVERDILAQVTPYQVHLKLGHAQSLAWVTDLATGEPVSGARVELLYERLFGLTLPLSPLAVSETDRRGLARLPGTRDLRDGELNLRSWWSHRDEPAPLVRVTRGSDMALLPAVGQFRVHPQGPGGTWIQTRIMGRFGHLRAFGTSAQGVYRPGDTVRYKLWVRDQDAERFVAAPRGKYALRVIDPLDRVVHTEKEIALNSFGSHAGEFLLADTVATGNLRFELSADFTKEVWTPLRVLVSDFTPAPFKVSNEIEGRVFGPGDSVRIETAARLHSGGPYTGGEARIVASLSPRPIEVAAPRASGFVFDSGLHASYRRNLHQQHEPIDANGDARVEFELPDAPIVHGELRVESAVRDDRGKQITATSTARYVARDRFVGLRHEGWLLRAGEVASFEVVVIDRAGQLALGAPVRVEIEYEEVTAARVKGAGNAYLTRYNRRWVSQETCSLESREDPVVCSFTPERGGAYRITASTRDSLGREHSSAIQRFAQAKGNALFEIEPGDRLDIVPEQTSYRVGDTARFLIKNPFERGTALVTTERLGVQVVEVRELDQPTAVIELEIREEHVPGFYLSVVLTSPRVSEALSEDGLDLGKPAVRTGYVRVPVRDPFKEIQVDLRVERPSYRPRERVEVQIEARARNGRTPPLEAAVAVIDEAVLDLIPGGVESYDPHAGFYVLEPLDVSNWSLLRRLVGLQRFEKKGQTPGGGGGAGPSLRSLFEFVSYWNPSIELDPRGRGSFAFEVPDNLTGWRVIVMAASDTDRFGLGQARFVVNRDTEIRPALPNRLIEGDRFSARFTVMNRTDQPRKLSAEVRVDGPVEPMAPVRLDLDAPPYQRIPIRVPVQVTAPGEVSFYVRAGDASDVDALSVSLPIDRRSTPIVAASYLSSEEGSEKVPIEVPVEIQSGTGELRVEISPSVIGGIQGAFEYLRDYPYTCWEQRLSRGVLAAQFLELRDHLSPEFEWPDAASAVADMLARAASFQAPNGAMTYYRPEDRYASPYLSAYTALAFNWLRESGHAAPAAVEERLHAYLEKLLRLDTTPEFYTPSMLSSVRAVALAALAPHGSITRADLVRFAPHAERMDLFGRSHFLQAALHVDPKLPLVDEVLDGLLAASDQTGGELRFTEEIETTYARIHHSAERATCTILSGLVRARGRTSLPDDLAFKLVRAVTQARKRKDRWENTQENVFCLSALIEYSKSYETTPPELDLELRFGDEPIGNGQLRGVRDQPVLQKRKLTARDTGRASTLEIRRKGRGRYYAAVRLAYHPSSLRSEAILSGMEIRREYSVKRDGVWKLLEGPIRLERGELVRVDLFLHVPAARSFIVVDDPVPGALEPVDRNLANSSEVDASEGDFEAVGGSYWYRHDDWLDITTTRWRFYHREMRDDAVRFYSEWVPPGGYVLSYTAQVIAAGEFSVLPVHAEQMYEPDVFGKGRPRVMQVSERP